MYTLKNLCGKYKKNLNYENFNCWWLWIYWIKLINFSKKKKIHFLENGFF